MFFNECGYLKEPCTSCNSCYVDDLSEGWHCDKKECPYKSKDSDFSRVIMPEHRALAYTQKEENEMAKKNAVKSNVNVNEEETKKVSTKAKKPVEEQAEEQEEPETKKMDLKDKLKKGAKTVALIVGVIGAVAIGNKIGQSKGYASGIRDAKDLQGSVPALPEPEPEEENIIEDDESSDDVV